MPNTLNINKWFRITGMLVNLQPNIGLAKVTGLDLVTNNFTPTSSRSLHALVGSRREMVTGMTAAKLY